MSILTLRLVAYLGIMSACFCLSACGQTGALFLAQNAPKDTVNSAPTPKPIANAIVNNLPPASISSTPAASPEIAP